MAESELDLDSLIAEDAEEVVEEVVEEEAKAEEPEEESRANTRIRQLVEERNQVREEMAKQQSAMAEMKEAVQALAKAQAEPEAKVDFMEDPQGYVDSKLQRQESELEALKKQAEDGDLQSQQRMAQMQFAQAIQNDESAFVRTNPDYYEALNHLREQRRDELEDLGLTEEEVVRTITNEELQAAAIASQKGTSAAQYVYNRAKRYGYAGKALDNDKLNEDADRIEAAQRAGSMGGSGIPEESKVDDPEEAAWAPIEAAFEELFGEKLR